MPLAYVWICNSLTPKEFVTSETWLSKALDEGSGKNQILIILVSKITETEMTVRKGTLQLIKLFCKSAFNKLICNNDWYVIISAMVWDTL